MNDCGRNHPDSALVDNCGRCGAPVCCSWCCEVDALEAQVERLEKALEKIYDNAGDHDLIVDTASAALEG